MMVDAPYINSIHVEDNDTAYIGWSTGVIVRVLWNWDNTLDNIKSNSRPTTVLVDERALEDKEKFPFNI